MINFHPWYSKTDDQLLQEIGERLKQIRLNANLSQQQIGDLTGKSKSEISKIEAGKPISLKSFLRIMRALNKLENIEKATEYPSVNPNLLRKLEEKKKKRVSKKNSNI